MCKIKSRVYGRCLHAASAVAVLYTWYFERCCVDYCNVLLASIATVLDYCWCVQAAQLPVEAGEHDQDPPPVWSQVQDFDWIKATPSPHWCVCIESE